MPSITKILGQNIKGQSFDLEIKPLCVITGDNGAGKTAVADTVRVGLLGYDPNLGERVNDTFLLCSGLELVTSLGYSDGTAITRRWAAESGSVRYSGPEDEAVPAVLFNARDYLKRTAKERVAMMFERIAKTAKFQGAALVAQIKGIVIEGHDEAAQVIVQEIADEVADMDKERVQSGEPLPAWLNRVAATLRERESEAAAVVKTMRASLKSQAALQANSGLVTIRPGLEAELAKAREEKDRLLKLYTEAKANKDNAAQNAAAFAASRQALVDNPECEGAMKTAEAMVAKLKAATAGKAEGWPVLQPKVTKAAVLVESTAAGVRAAAKDLESHQEDLAKATAGTCCPECGTKTEAWKKKRIAKYGPLVKAAQVALDEATATAAKAKAAHVALLAQEKAAKAQDAVLKTDLSNLALAEADLAKWKAQHSARVGAQKFLARVPVVVAKEFDFAGTIAAGKALATKIEELEGEQRKATAARADAKRREEAKTELEDTERQVKVAKAATKILVETQEKIIAESVGGFMAESGALLERVMGKRLEFRDGAIGFWRGTQWVSHKTFCGVDEYCAFAGLALALADKSKVKVVILDELGKLTKERKLALLGVVKELVKAGKIDNFIGIDPEASDYKGQGVQLIPIMEPKGQKQIAPGLLPAALAA